MLQLNRKSISRIAAIQTLYDYDSNPNKDLASSLLRIIEFYKDKAVKKDYDLPKTTNYKVRPSYKYLQELVDNTGEYLSQIDIVIGKHLSAEWSLDKLSILLRSLLRVAICEITYFPETPKKVVISEYTDIAGDMLDENEIGFVNSILENIAQKIR